MSDETRPDVQPSPEGDGPAGTPHSEAADSADAQNQHGSGPVENDESQQETSASGRRRKRQLPVWADTLVTMLVALLIAVLVKTFLFQPFYIPSASMNPTLVKDDKILVSKLTPGVFQLHRGDVIVFQDPDDWIPGDATQNPTPRVRLMMVLSLVGLAPDPSQDHLVKRLIGLPGDHVVCTERGADLQVNGTTVKEPYINPDTGACQARFDVVIPANNVWVMGDNRYASADSAWHQIRDGNGFVPIDDITGKAEFVFWPAAHWTGLDGGQDAFADVPAHP